MNSKAIIGFITFLDFCCREEKYTYSNYISQGPGKTHMWVQLGQEEQFSKMTLYDGESMV